MSLLLYSTERITSLLHLYPSAITRWLLHSCAEVGTTAASITSHHSQLLVLRGNPFL